MDEKYLLSLAKELRKHERNLRLAIEGDLRDRITAYVDKLDETVNEMHAVLRRG